MCIDGGLQQQCGVNRKGQVTRNEGREELCKEQQKCGVKSEKSNKSDVLNVLIDQILNRVVYLADWLLFKSHTNTKNLFKVSNKMS